MPVRISLKCKSCGLEIDARSSDGPIPRSCPSCGSREMEFSVSLMADGKRDIEECSHVPLKPLIEDSFVKQVSPGEYLIDLSPPREVAIAELEPGVYEILITGFPLRNHSKAHRSL
ncbi:MAG: hypothetical protein QXJ48_06430 [Candidatus Korarchaeum sp.]